MGFVYVHPCISLSGDSKSKEAFPLHPWHYFLFRPVIYLRLCSVLMLSAPFSLSPSPLPLYLHWSGHRTQPGTQNYLQAEKYKQHNIIENLCVTFYKQIWLTLAELDWLWSLGVRAGRWVSEDCLTPWLPDCLGCNKLLDLDLIWKTNGINGLLIFFSLIL